MVSSFPPGCDENVHLFYQDNEQSTFKYCGIIKEMKKGFLDLEMLPCLGLKLTNIVCYLLEPMVCGWNLVGLKSYIFMDTIELILYMEGTLWNYNHECQV